jgi:hypothetical protein
VLKRELIRNTFFREFVPVDGMAEVYRRWQHQFAASFHFVSASPWQLQPELQDFARSQGFPPASYHLKSASAPFPSWSRSILTEIYLCHACSYHVIEDGNGAPGALQLAAGLRRELAVLVREGIGASVCGRRVWRGRRVTSTDPHSFVGSIVCGTSTRSTT